MKTYQAEIMTPERFQITCTVKAADYTAAYLTVIYNYPLNTYIIELKEI